MKNNFEVESGPKHDQAANPDFLSANNSQGQTSNEPKNFEDRIDDLLKSIDGKPF